MEHSPPNSMTDALVLDNLNLAKYILVLVSRRWASVRRLEPDDALQVAYLGLIDAAQRWEPGRGCKFNSWAGHVIASALAEASQTAGAVRVPWQRRKGAETQAAQVRAASGMQQLGDYDPPCDECEQPTDTDTLLAAIGQLSDRQQEVLRLRFWEGLTHREVAERLGCSRQNSRRVEAGALEELRELLGFNWEPRARGRAHPRRHHV